VKNLVRFFNKVGNLKEMPRRGWVINDIKNPESIADHIFRASLMAWILGDRKSGLKMERLLKMALIQDLCEIYAGDTTPYDSVLPKDDKERKEYMKKWPRFTNSQKLKLKQKKHKKEEKALNKLLKDLPLRLRKEIKNLWMDYEKGLTPEGRFFKQADRLENFLQATEYWKKYNQPPQGPWWEWAREFFDDTFSLEFIEEMAKQFHKKFKKKK